MRSEESHFAGAPSTRRATEPKDRKRPSKAFSKKRPSETSSSESDSEDENEARLAKSQRKRRSIDKAASRSRSPATRRSTPTLKPKRTASKKKRPKETGNTEHPYATGAAREVILRLYGKVRAGEAQAAINEITGISGRHPNRFQKIYRRFQRRQ
jgi:hypothetical protein